MDSNGTLSVVLCFENDFFPSKLKERRRLFIFIYILNLVIRSNFEGSC